jgi:hypothetical protein
MPNRSDLIDAAAASVENARHFLEQAEKRVKRRRRARIAERERTKRFNLVTLLK